MKRFISRRDFLMIAGAAGVAGAMTACGGSSSSTAASSGAASTAASANAEYTLKVSHTQNADTPVVQGMYEFQRIVEEKSGGRMKIEVYPSGSLGDTSELVTERALCNQQLRRRTEGSPVRLFQRPAFSVGRRRL